MKLGKSPEAIHLAYSFVTAFAPTAVSSAYAKPSLYRTVSIWAKFFRRKDDMNEGATLVQKQTVHLILLAVDYLGILRTYHRAAAAEDTPFLDDLRLVILDFDRLHRTLPEAFITVLATGFLELEVFFHKSGIMLSFIVLVPAGPA